jgi:hypothetical protein
MSVLGNKVDCNACHGRGYRYLENPYAMAPYYPPPVVCTYCDGTGKREIIAPEPIVITGMQFSEEPQK